MENSFSSHKQYLLGLLFSRNTRETHADQKILQTFLLWLKRNVSQTFKVAVMQINNKYMINSTQITNTEIFTIIAVLVFKLLSHKALFTYRKKQ